MIPVNRPLFGGNEKAYLAECIDTGWISSEGPFVKRLEHGIAQRVGRTHGVAVSNGSAALDLALATLRLGNGDEVIMPSFTIISCAAAIIRTGATPVVVDCQPDTGNIDPDLIEASITSRTRAIMVVHIYGLPVDMDPVMAIAEAHGLFVIEDAAEQLGQTYRGRPIGSFGHMSTLSFYPNKHVTTGEGGMVLVDDDALADRARSLRNLSFDRDRRFIHAELGWNFRMSNLQAAIGVAQLEQLDVSIARKRAIGHRYQHRLQAMKAIALPLDYTDYAENIYWVFGVVLDDDVPFDAATMIARLRVSGVDARHFFWPMHLQPALRERGLFAGVSCPNAERLAVRGLYLPSGTGILDDEVDKASETLMAILR